jgi:hypothetical protein
MSRISKSLSPKARNPDINPEDGWVGPTAVLNVMERRQMPRV